VDSDAQSQRNVGHMSDPELAAFAENVQRHGADLADVPTAVAYRQTTAHHVRVSYRLHLPVSRIIALLPTTHFLVEYTHIKIASRKVPTTHKKPENY